jgi:hypothetical protein
VDGPEALRWQERSDEYGNCAADPRFARAAMRRSGAERWRLHEGWFCDTLPAFSPPAPIALLRLDADWHDSTRSCLQSLAPHVASGGVVVLDDYDTWSGCALAVDEYVRANPEWRLGRAFGIVPVLRRGR